MQFFFDLFATLIITLFTLL